MKTKPTYPDDIRYRFVRELSPTEFNRLVLAALLDNPDFTRYEDCFDIVVDKEISYKEKQNTKGRGTPKKG